MTDQPGLSIHTAVGGEVAVADSVSKSERRAELLPTKTGRNPAVT